MAALAPLLAALSWSSAPLPGTVAGLFRKSDGPKYPVTPTPHPQSRAAHRALLCDFTFHAIPPSFLHIAEIVLLKFLLAVIF